MSRSTYRINKIEYEPIGLYFLNEKHMIYYYLLNKVLYVNDDECIFDIDIPELKKFMESYFNNTLKIDDTDRAELEEDMNNPEIIKALNKEIEYAEKHNKNVLTYEIF